MPRPRIAIATCADYAELKADDDLLREALRGRGCEAGSVVWDDEQVDWGGFDLCLVRSTWDYHERHDEFLDWTRRVEAETKLHNPSDLIVWNSEKTYLRELERHGAQIVPTIWLERGTGVDLEEVLATEEWEQAVIKPVIDLGAKNLHRVRAGEGSAALAAVLERHDAMVQPFLPSLETEGETSLVYVEGIFSHAVRKRPAAGDFRVQSIWGGSVARAEPNAGQVKAAEAALAQLEGAPLYARADLVTGLDGEPCLIELELIEPNLYLSIDRSAAARLADAVMAQLH